MKFLKLEILNLASLDHPGGQVIDFVSGPLGAGNIFSIIGPTGSGKSTILDAICLALYGNTPRYTRRKNERKTKFRDFGSDSARQGDIGETDPRNILSHGQKSGYSKLTFLGPDGRIYRSEWSVKFKLRNYERAQMALYRLGRDNNGKPSEEKLEIATADLLGIDFDRFQRTVIIAQGAFAGFLKSEPDARWKLLESIVGTGHIYKAIGAETASRFQAANKALEEINARIRVYKESILSPEELATLDADITRLNAEEQQRQERIAALEKAFAWYKTDEKMASDISLFEAAVKAADEKKAALAPKAADLFRRDATTEERQLLRDLRAAESKEAAYTSEITNTDSQIEAAEKIISQSMEALKELTVAAGKAAAEVEEKKPVIREARKIKTLITASSTLLETHRAALIKAEEEYKVADKALNDNIADIAKASEKVSETLSTKVALTAKTDKETERLQAAVNSALSSEDELSAKMAGQNLTSLQSAAAEASADLSALRDAIDLSEDIERISAEITRKDNEISDLGDANKALTNKRDGIDIRSVKEDIDTLKKSLTLMTSADWKRHRSKLSDGSPCPLCGSTDHPYQAEENYLPAVTGIELLIASKQSELSALEKQYNDLTELISSNTGKIAELGKSVAADRKEHNRTLTKLSALLALRPSLARPVADLRALLPEADTRSRETSEAINTYLDLASQQKKAHDRLDKARADLVKHKDDSEKSLATCEIAYNEARHLLARLEGSTEALRQSRSNAMTALANAGKDYDESEASIKSYKADLHNIIGDTDPDTLETDIARAFDNANCRVNETKEEISTKKESLERLKGKRENLVRQKQSSAAERHEINGRLAARLAAITLDGEPLSLDRLEVIEAMEGDWEEVRRLTKEADDGLTRATTTLDNALATRSSHSAERPEGLLSELREEHLSLKAISDEPLRNLRAQRRAHEEATVKASEVAPDLSQAQALVADLKKLNNAVGGEKAETLRQIAQCYTLRFLIDHANREIRRFNPRYELRQVDRSLAIRVIDHDRADTIRETTSLSGGETFIVSLGLALGLSALSSCRAASFDNLFIDEGFGTLDSETLATVVESLASLQSSLGKKVGVISHTEAMTERISTHIRVSPVAGRPGSSTIVIEA